ncbi:capping protein inhibiting regulator of actin dynamics [Syngnathoides biaculeatus]|uniref:capping protein inhibiting regulator of actin dynamics n=1 Tax=Syngnathoides biaculeatus TaxID=300417 RepID=UPI002ADE8B26|nr:capping protein inhibiting regulator of actin dynamics [Syngnathoides biaculeatus]XP_061680407.1 capping protein inhibiting regulator of actin dynamics [Syngnathoides biaculeatus]XP_061680408.1 capping protein inhibiting regulator of actin dynamics [Syngnathoides biaculeatus]
MSQENVSDKVKNLQKQIAQNIKFGQKPPSLRRSEGDEISSEEDEEAPQSPLRVTAQVEMEPLKAETAVGAALQATSHGTPVKSPRSRKVLPPGGTIESVNLDAIPQSASLLDNTAAKHKLSVKPKNQRISRKHRRFTEDVQEISISGAVQEDLEVTGITTEHRRRSCAEKSPEDLEEQERLDQKRKRALEEEERRQRAEQLRIEEEERCRKQREEKEKEERRLREEEARRMRKEEERRQQEDKERKEEEERRMRTAQRRKEEEEARRQQELEAQRLCLEEEESKKKKDAKKQRFHEIQAKHKLDSEEQPKRTAQDEGDRRSDTQERKRRADELRWREMEERQRPFSFQVSSGEKEILFPKVNLTPVTPPSVMDGSTVASREGISPSSEAPYSPNRQSSPYVPHTAILVTGTQLCGTAVNLDQIRDTACKSLLGLSEERKAQGIPPAKTKTSPDRKSAKTKSLTESPEPDPAGAAVLAEWATIRSKIFKGVEEGSEYPDPNRIQPQASHEDQHEFPHTHLRKTMSASAKFSITPAKKKFGGSNRNSECSSTSVLDDKMGEDAISSDASSSASPAARRKAQNRISKGVRLVDRPEDECVFAKDLPSFLVPSPGAKPEEPERKAQDRTGSAEPESRVEGDEPNWDGGEKPSPFGIKLRRTNYSLRFHNEQSTEKRKKRYSAGDSFDGVPSPLTPIELDSDASSVFSDRSSPTSPQREAKYSLALASPVVPRAILGKSPSPTPRSDGDNVPSKSSLYRRPPASLKPAEGVPACPPSPLPKTSHSETEDSVGRGQPTAVAQLHRSSQGQGEDEPKEKRSFFQSINIPWRDKMDRKTEIIKREKPSLQSRHSLDSARVQEKEAGPLWITLALQKQKGFREQQQNREERRSLREAKLSEKQARERDSVGSATTISPTESRGRSGSVSPGCKAPTPDEPKRPDSLLGRFERREQLKKSNTLPSSVTVEITDSTPSPPAVKEVSKRFPTMDSPQVSTEPAWLALAKRKAKAWSDCPQIIK